MTEKLLWPFNTTCEKLDMTEYQLRWRIRMRDFPEGTLKRIGKGRGKFYFDPKKLQEWSNKLSVEGNGGT